MRQRVNDPGPDWPAVRAQAAGAPCSRRALAALVLVSARALGRWLTGEDHPPRRAVIRLRRELAWLASGPDRDTIRRRAAKRRKDHAHYSRQRAHIGARTKKYREANAKKYRDYRARWAAAHPGQAALGKRRWQQRHPEAGRRATRRSYHRRAAVRRELGLIAAAGAISRAAPGGG